MSIYSKSLNRHVHKSPGGKAQYANPTSQQVRAALSYDTAHLLISQYLLPTNCSNIDCMTEQKYLNLNLKSETVELGVNQKGI